MQCPYCQTDNRDDQEKCYHCDRDLSTLRVIVNKAKHHYNQGLEFADRGRNDEAITEMKNAIDLDGSLINARVVLGTLYAKQEKFDLAREAWSGAMAQDHRYQKAHEYLAKADVVEAALPALKHQQELTKKLGIGLVAAVVVALIAIVANFVGGPPPPAPGLPPEHQTATLPTTGTQPQATPVAPAPAGSDAAVRLAAQIEKLNTQLTEARQQAQSARDRLAALEAGRLDLAVTALGNGDPELALELVASLNGADAAQTERAAKIRTQALDAMAAALQSAGEGVLAGEPGVQDFQRRSAQFLKLAGDAPQAAAIRTLADKVNQIAAERMLAEANDKIANAPLDEAVRAAQTLKASRPELADQLNLTLDLRFDAELSALGDAVTSLTAQGDFDAARARIDMLAEAERAAGRNAADQLDALRQTVAEQQGKAALADANAAFAAKQWDGFLEQAGKIDAAALPEAARNRLETRIAEARQRRAEADWDWFQGLDPKFSDERVSRDEAEHAVSIYRRTIAELPQSMEWTKAPILYYTAVANLKLGKPDQARALLGEIDAMDRVPDYIKTPVRKLREKHADALGAAPAAAAQ